MTTAAQIQTTASIQSRAILVWLTLRSWTARKYDRKVTDEVNKRHAASSDAGRYNKFLLPGECPAYQALMTKIAAVRQEHYSKTLAWTDEGWRVLSNQSYMAYMEWYRQRSSEIEMLARDFYAAYPDLVKQAKSLLNGMYREEDYPSLLDLRSRFECRIEMAPIPAAGDVRVELPADQIAEIEASINRTVRSAVDTAMGDARKRLYDVIAKARTKLAEPDGIFRNSLIENIREICDLLPSLTITADPDLDQFRRDALRELANVQPDTLREDKAVRADVASKADQILAQMTAVYGL